MTVISIVSPELMPYVKRIAEDWIGTHSDKKLIGSWCDPLLLIEVIIESSPHWGWFIIISIINMDVEGDSLLDLIHGPLESWVFRHAVSSIDLIEEEARDNDRFRWALGGLVKPKDPDPIWERLEVARSSRSSGDTCNNP